MHDDMISAIYDAPLASRPWAAVLPKLRHATAVDRLMLKFSPVNAADGGTIYTSSARSEDDYVPGGPSNLYRMIYQYKDPVSYAGMSGGDICQLDDLIDHRAFTASDFYRELCAPLNIEHAFFAHLGQYEGTDVWLNGSRGTVQGAFSADEIASVRELIPHLSRAVRMHHRLDRLQSQSMLYAQSMSALGVGAIMLDRQGDIVETNAEAATILAAGSPVRQVGKRFYLTGIAQRSFAAALDRMARSAALNAQVLVANDGVSSVNVVIRRADDVIGKDAHSPVAFILYLNRAAQPLPPRAIDFVSQAFGLSRTEARLSVLLANGHALESAAVLLGVTPTTARTYCKRTFAKTGTKRQSELVRLVLSSLARLT